MPRGLERFHHSKQSHFITFTCYRRLCHLANAQARNLFVNALEQTRSRYGLRVYSFVVMLEHIHLLISEPERGTVANAIQSVKISSSMRCGVFRERDGLPFWQKRYYDRNIRDYDEFVEKLRYIHRNPVNRGLCEKPEDWPWSSFRHYATGEDCGVEIESKWTADKRRAMSPHLGLAP
jgi:putative transposase